MCLCFSSRDVGPNVRHCCRHCQSLTCPSYQVRLDYFFIISNKQSNHVRILQEAVSYARVCVHMCVRACVRECVCVEYISADVTAREWMYQKHLLISLRWCAVHICQAL